MTHYFKILIITPENVISREGTLINALFEAGLEVLHIRKPGLPKVEIQNLINSISADFHSRVVIHSHYELVHDFHLKGIHLPEKLRKEALTNETLKVISTSFHKLEDITNENKHFEYAFLSPVFESISKQGYHPFLAIQQIKSFLAHPIPFPLIALGGISDKNVMQVREMGFSGAACIGYIWESQNPVEQFNKLIKVLTSIN